MKSIHRISFFLLIEEMLRSAQFDATPLFLDNNASPICEEGVREQIQVYEMMFSKFG
jgi:hypothetical protein